MLVHILPGYNEHEVPRAHPIRSLAILLLIAGTLSLQAASLSSDHSSDHAAHCCGVCHLAHLVLTNPVQSLSVAAPLIAGWDVSIEKSPDCTEALVAMGQSRAPPA
jgi:hypothetical protein